MIEKSEIYDLAKNALWYHTIKLTHDIETSGTYNHSLYLNHYGFPERMDGLTALDVGAADGFFSFEFEKRGAKEILAIDTNGFDGSMAINPSFRFEKNYIEKYMERYHTNMKFEHLYRKLGLSGCNMFLVARAILNSKARYEQKSIYDMSCGEKFDLVFCGDLIEHLKDPLTAVEKLYSLTRGLCVISLSSIPGGHDSNQLLRYDGNKSGGSFFHFYAGTFRQALLSSGFKVVNRSSIFDLLSKRSVANRHAVFQCIP